MAEFKFYGDWSDARNLLELILEERELAFIFDTYYSKKVAPRITNITELPESLPFLSGYIWGPYSEAEPEFYRFKGPQPNRGKFVIAPFAGGQKMKYCPCQLNDLNALGLGLGKTLSPGFIDYNSWFWRGNSEEMVLPGKLLKEYYKRIVAKFKKYLVKMHDKKTVWISPHAHKLIKANFAELV